MAELLPLSALPDSFQYPAQFIRVVELGLTNLEPWWILTGERLRTRYNGMHQRYPNRSLVPFAIRQENDDVGCFDIDRGSVVIVHDFASAGYEQRAEFEDFNAWFRQAIDDLIEFE